MKMREHNIFTVLMQVIILRSKMERKQKPASFYTLFTPTMAAQWLWCRAAELEDAGSAPAAVVALLIEAKSENPHASRFLRLLKVPRWSELICSPPLWQA